MGALSQPLHNRQIKEFTARQVLRVALLERARAARVHMRRRLDHDRNQLAPRLDAVGTIKHTHAESL